jgi:hypothetical protein
MCALAYILVIDEPDGRDMAIIKLQMFQGRDEFPYNDLRLSCMQIFEVDTDISKPCLPAVHF